MTIRLRTALAALALLAGSAAAGPKQQEAKRHIDKATKLHKDGKFADALVELDAAYKLDPKPDLLFAIGQIHSKLGQCTEATDYFQKFGKAIRIAEEDIDELGGRVGMRELVARWCECGRARVRKECG